ncbi:MULTISPECIES: hypothetical protein [Vibrio]|uniref:hypothetical protein n=1 Tax=Vibrio TaxID=662 RepID=UPI000586D815|nr:MULTISPECIES: hypothetical protein [Vibrio]MCM5510382.1 hypothetical protein [Vibrio sp. SCSIO 43169]MDE3900029.1 hypothetical protein [Vibrio sp. CC007]NRF64408.1 hypothetical protein [Vibrio coralliilyticus]QFT38754.1 hypothetical protein FIU99_20510 [Vibrio sp. THAF64]QGM36708.1 hypothetical protein GGC04_20720 [Vibrio sp. THAF191d]
MKSLSILIATLAIYGCVTTPKFEQDISGQWQCSAESTIELVNLKYSDNVHYFEDGHYEKESLLKITNLDTDITYDVNILSSGKWMKRNASLLEVIDSLETTFSDNSPEKLQKVITDKLFPTVTEKWKLKAVNESKISMTAQSGNQLSCEKG